MEIGCAQVSPAGTIMVEASVPMRIAEGASEATGRALRARLADMLSASLISLQHVNREINFLAGTAQKRLVTPCPVTTDLIISRRVKQGTHVN
jgi:hypothetical protein